MKLLEKYRILSGDDGMPSRDRSSYYGVIK